MAKDTVDALARANETDMVRARRNQEQFKSARDAGHDKYVELSMKCDDFYRGHQWDDADKARLDSQGRPALTLNMVLSTVNAILGE